MAEETVTLSQEQFDQLLAKAGQKPETKPPKPKPAKAAARKPAGKPKRWNHQEALAEMEKDLPTALMKIVSQQLGVGNLSNHLDALSSGINATYDVAQQGVITSALRANGVTPTREAIEDFRNSLDEEPADRQTPSFSNYDSAAKKFIKNDWLAVAEKVDTKGEKPSGEKTSTTVETEAKEQVLPSRGSQAGINEKVGASEDGGSSESDLEAAARGDRKTFLDTLRTAQHEAA